MDPNRTLDIIIDCFESGDVEDADEACENLANWLSKGGFQPTRTSRLDDLPTKTQGQAADLKIDTGDWRVWLSRCGEEDGEFSPVQLEQRVNGRWVDRSPDC